jgi:hypothetical protein
MYPGSKISDSGQTTIVTSASGKTTILNFYCGALLAAAAAAIIAPIISPAVPIFKAAAVSSCWGNLRRINLKRIGLG